MDLRILSTQQGSETTLYAEGRIVLGEASNYLRNYFRELLDQGQARISLNLRAVSYIDSGGLGELAGCFTAVTRRGGRMRIVAPSERVSRLLRLTRIDEVIPVIGHDAEANDAPSGAEGSTPGYRVAGTPQYPQASAR